MAETVITDATTTSINHAGHTTTRTIRRIVVRSITADRIDVSVIRDFTAALDAVDAPRRTQVRATASDGHLTGLVAEWETQPPLTDPVGGLTDGAAS